MGKRSVQEVFNDIISSIEKGNNTIYAIKEDIGANWKTVKNNVDILRELDVVDKKGDNIVLTEETESSELLGLPVDDEIRTDVTRLASEISLAWNSTYESRLGKTFMQKIMVEVIKKEDLSIPTVWYLYGKMVPLEIEAEEETRSTEYVDSIKEVFEEFDFTDKYELQRAFYNKYDKKDYLTRLDIDLLFRENFQLEKFQDLLMKQLYHYDISQDHFSLFRDGVSLLIKTAKKIDVEDSEDVSILESMFRENWGIYASYNFLETLRGDLDVDEDVLKRKVNKKVEEHKQKLLELSKF